MSPPRLLAACAVLGFASLALVPVAPAYDPWAWLLWGRELAGGALDTREGPAFKPLPVAVCVLLSPLGDAAPAAWLGLARGAMLAAIALGALLARRLAGPGRLAPLAAGVAVALTGRLLAESAAGASEGLLVALALGGALAWRAGRGGLVLGCAAAACLVRVEAWPFAAAAGLALWRTRPALRPALALAAAAVPALWIAPEWLGSGDPWRSGARARVPNPGQPALAAVPALASLGAAAGTALAPAALGALALLPGAPRAASRPGGAARPGGAVRAWGAAAPGAALGVATAGVAWVLLVAVMSPAGFSGEPRYAAPGVALIGVGGAVGLAALARGRAAAAGRGRPPTAGLVLGAVVLLAAVPRIAGLPGSQASLAHAARLSADLERAIADAGGRDRVLACGRPYVGPLRGPLLAYRLGVVKRRVGFAPRPPGAVFVSRLAPGAPPEPAVPAGFARGARAGRWSVHFACRQPPASQARISAPCSSSRGGPRCSSPRAGRGRGMPSVSSTGRRPSSSASA